MPKITSGKTKARLVIHVDSRTLDAYQSSLKRAEEAGLQVDVTGDFESLLRRLTKIVNDAIEESAPASTPADHS